MAANRSESDRYRAYVRRKLQELTPIFARAAVGDFSQNLELPDQDDEFADLAVGIQVMLEVIRQQLAELRKLNQSLEARVAGRTAALAEAQALAHLGSWEWDSSTDALQCSDELYRIFGFESRPERLTLEAILERVHADDRATLRLQIENAYRSGGAFALDHRIVRPDGSVSMLSTRGETLRDRDGRPTGMIGTGQDITARQRIEDALRDSEEKYRSLVETARDVIFSISAAGIITSLNSAFDHATGWDRHDWIGKSFLGLLHPDDRAEAGARVRKVLAGEIVPSHEWRILSRSGEYLTGEVTPSPLVRGGRVVGILGIARDITERRRIEQRVQLLAHTLESMNEAVTITDIQNRIIFVNKAFVKIYGYSRSEVVGTPVESLRAPDTPAALSAEIMKATVAGGWQGELMNRRKSGELFPILLSTSAIRDNQAKLVSLVGIARDITREKELQRALDEIAREHTEHLRRFATSVQQAQEEERRRIARELHDGLGQQLTGMKFDIEVFEDTLPKSQTQTRKKLRQVKRRIDGLIAEIRRISSNLHPAALDDFGLNVALGLLVREFERVHRIKVTFNAGDGQVTHDDPQVRIALYRIAQEALANIARHASAASVRIDLNRGADSVSLDVHDDGRGFDSSTPAGRGRSPHGLGLISMKERSEQLGGTFVIHSLPHQGTSIHVELPARP